MTRIILFSSNLEEFFDSYGVEIAIHIPVAEWTRLVFKKIRGRASRLRLVFPPVEDGNLISPSVCLLTPQLWPRIFIILVVVCFVKSTTAYGVAQISHPLAAVRLPRSVKNSEMSGNLIEMTVEENPNQCLCVKSECGCCVYLDVPEIRLNSSGCIEVAYLSEDIGLAISFTFDDRTLLNTSVSVKNPPPLCIMIPFLKDYGHICLEFYNVDFSSSHYAACVKIDVAIWPFCALPFELGCFHINGQSVTDYETFTKTKNRTHALEDSNNDQVWRKKGYRWRYAVCSSNSNYVSSYYQVAMMNVLLLAFVYSMRKLQV
ncbi:hypothetical protein AVEN_193884-1 [Araneus ventricosus]|uniref:DUF4773 domain-containing protein n=1 Tax=Araneus ventricosus TaxID=182803 RepID=A0A4Y2M129_ARAVE|nr:hypothetical protein AVEN_193884-1 [Araneus ventricosus]